jgi:hypothetical protein
VAVRIADQGDVLDTRVLQQLELHVADRDHGPIRAADPVGGTAHQSDPAARSGTARSHHPSSCSAITVSAPEFRPTVARHTPLPRTNSRPGPVHRDLGVRAQVQLHPDDGAPVAVCGPVFGVASRHRRKSDIATE